MRKKDYKGRCEKRVLDKCNSLFKSYDPIQSAYANILVKNKDVAEIQCNVPLDGEVCEEYMSDFLCVMQSGDMMVPRLFVFCKYSSLLAASWVATFSFCSSVIGRTPFLGSQWVPSFDYYRPFNFQIQ